MSIVKPPVSSSIGIEIKAPEGIIVEGDTIVRELVSGKKPGVVLIIYLDDDTIDSVSVEDDEIAYDLACKFSKNGYSVEKEPDFFIHYPPHRIRKIEYRIKNL